MSWDEILGHQSALDRFKRTVDRRRLASTYLFVGPEGVGKRTFALKLAQSLLCDSNPESKLEPCGQCPSCQQVRAKSHPDLILISKPKDKAFIPVETFIGDKEHRRQQGLCHEIGLKPFGGGRKVAIIDDADFLNLEGANSLLKTLEEPPPKSLLILIGTSQHRQLSTIVSRSQIVRFSQLSSQQVCSILQRPGVLESEDLDAEKLAASSGGSVATAIRLSDPETFEFRGSFFSQLANRDPAEDDFAASVIAFVDAVGKDAAKKRLRLVMVGDFAIAFYRQWCQQLVGAQAEQETGDLTIARYVEDGIEPWVGSGADTGSMIAAQCIERTTEMQTQVLRNAGTANVVDAWLRDLGRINRNTFSSASLQPAGLLIRAGRFPGKTNDTCELVCALTIRWNVASGVVSKMMVGSLCRPSKSGI